MKQNGSNWQKLAEQFAYLKKTWENSSASFLVLNTGFQSLTGVDNDITDFAKFIGEQVSKTIDKKTVSISDIFLLV